MSNMVLHEARTVPWTQKSGPSRGVRNKFNSTRIYIFHLCFYTTGGKFKFGYK